MYVTEPLASPLPRLIPIHPQEWTREEQDSGLAAQAAQFAAQACAERGRGCGGGFCGLCGDGAGNDGGDGGGDDGGEGFATTPSEDLSGGRRCH
jgi:hypothetical protein